MVRFYTGIFAIIAATLMAPSAVAQFGSIFDPPRPPGSIPERPELLPPGPPPVAPPNQVRPRDDDVQSQPLPAPPAASQVPPGARFQPPPQPNMVPAPPVDDAVPEPPTPKYANPTAVFSGLDKITGRITSFDVAINETVRFGALEVTPRICYTRPPTELPQTDGFVEVDELTLQGELRRIFTGWMFAASPGLNAVEHPIYDVWLTDCKGGGPAAATAEAPVEQAPAQRPAPRQQQRPARNPPPPVR
jgi:hypothetical protein